MQPQAAVHSSGQGIEIVARQGLRLPQVMLKHVRDSGIYCQPTVSIEYQSLAKKYVLRGVESGGAVAALGAYSSFVGECGEPLPWLQRVDSIRVNAVRAIVVAPVLVRLQMVRIERTYDLLITRHALRDSAEGKRPKLDSSILFYGRRGGLEMELWGKDQRFSGTVCPAFYTRAGEVISLPRVFQAAAARMTEAVCCIQCRHCHLLSPRRLPELTESVPPLLQEWMPIASEEGGPSGRRIKQMPIAPARG
jgi:hypothetical protein